ncbi:MAG: hypothetical protein NVV59_08975 [Chitinophagaceae bacterium]|nr:hypothetical protein [Chitinophagaceae bacterium]
MPLKKIHYKYDLVSGKVNEVAYQPGKRDQFYHRYQYDASNRLTQVYTSHDYLYWERQADYQYYKHGPLARMELGQLKVQGVDYAYTIQGWLKGVNSAANGAAFDMGGDGSNIDRASTDAYGFQLQYNNVDYKAIKNVYPFATAEYFEDQSDALRTGRGLFNGNIGSMLVNIPKLGSEQIYGYAYDQLNRIVGMNAYTGSIDDGHIVPVPMPANDYLERVSYDGNGNILTYKRNGEGANVSMDNLSYQYDYDLVTGKLNNNRLQYVTDAVTGNPANYGDIKTQSSGNYAYDEIGNLTKDLAEGIGADGIQWNVYGKISQIVKTVDMVTTTINYTYDVTGNRIGKAVQVGSGTPVITWYVRDASGNVMAIYEKENPSTNAGELTQIEIPLYGSSRLGMWRPMRALEGENWELFDTDPAPGTSGVRPEEFVRGRTQYELSNHLGNVLVTISDNRIPVDDATYDVYVACPSCIEGFPCLPCQNLYVKTSDSPDGIVDHYTAQVITANDYYPFGMVMPGRKFAATDAYRYGFNGKENDNEVKGDGNQQDYGMRIYDPRLGRFLSVDPLENDFPWNSPYSFSEGDPINYIDLDGAEKSKSELQQLDRQYSPRLELIKANAALNLIALRGASDAYLNANTFGFTDWWGSTSNLGDYNTDQEREAYLLGRLSGDVLAGLQGATEVGTGGTAASMGLSVSGTGVGAVGGIPTAVGGALVAGHGAAVGATAASDIGWVLKKLYQLNIQSTEGDVTAGTNHQVQSAHQKK